MRTPFKQWLDTMAKVIRAEMTLQKHSIEAVAKIIGIHHTTLSRKLKEPGRFTAGELGQLSELLSIDPRNPQVKA